MATGPRYSDTDTGITKRAISDVISMIDWTEAPLLRILGFGGDNVKKFNVVNWPSTKLEWIEDTMSPSTSLLTENMDTSETGMDVTASTGVYFRQGDVVATYAAADLNTILEKMLVTSVSTDTLTVVRGYGDTDGTAATTGDTVKILTRAMPENATATTGHTTTTTQPYNYTQIISEAVEVSRTAAKMSTYGIEDLMDYHVSKLFADNGSAGRLAQFLAQTFYYGERVQRSGITTYGSMGGFGTYVTAAATSTSHVFDLSGNAITRADIHKVIRAVREENGKVTHLITGGWGMEKIEAMYEGNRTYEQDSTLGGSEILAIRTPHGKVKVVYDFMCDEDKYYFVNKDKCGWLPFDEFKRGEITTERDGHTVDVIGEFTFALANPKSHGFIYGASTTA